LPPPASRSPTWPSAVLFDFSKKLLYNIYRKYERNEIAK